MPHNVTINVYKLDDDAFLIGFDPNATHPWACETHGNPLDDGNPFTTPDLETIKPIIEQHGWGSHTEYGMSNDPELTIVNSFDTVAYEPDERDS